MSLSLYIHKLINLHTAFYNVYVGLTHFSQNFLRENISASKIDCCHNLKNNSLPFQGFNLFNGQIRFFSPKGDVFATMMAVFWNKTVLDLRPVQELALRHKDGRTGRWAEGHSHHEWCFYCFFSYVLKESGTNCLADLAKSCKNDQLAVFFNLF